MPATTAAPSTTTREQHGVTGLPEPPAAGSRFRRLDRAGARARGRRHAGADAAARPRPLERLRHRRPGRPRLRPRRRARQAIEEARTAGRPPERLLLEQGAIDADQLSRAVAERYGLDHIDLSRLSGRHGGREPDPGQHGAPLQGAAGRLRRHADPARRDGRPGQRARRRRHPDRHRRSTAASRSPPRRTSRR